MNNCGAATDTITIARIKQSLLILKWALGLVIGTLPFIMVAVLERLDTLHAHATEIATLSVKISEMQKDLDKLTRSNTSARACQFNPYVSVKKGKVKCLNGCQKYSNTPPALRLQ